VLAVRVWDDDGEFLLIECAESLPSWVTPETATGTTFLRKGALLVVDAESLGNRTSDVTYAALMKILSDEEDSKSSAMTTMTYALNEETQETLRRRLDAVPAKEAENRHDVFVIVPARVAHVLHHEPQLVALAIERFRARDPLGLRAAAEMAIFAPENLTPALVRMSRCLFSQIAREHFEAPKCYPMPSQSAQEFKGCELGMKIACGFEMLLADSPRSVEDGHNKAESTGEPTDDAAWHTFKASLLSNGYFRNEMAGSALYKTLLANAVREFKCSALKFKSQSARSLAPAERVREILTRPMTPISVPVGVTPSDASDESWILEAERDLNEELAKLEREREGTISAAARAAKAFVNRESGFEGVEQTSLSSAPLTYNDKDGGCPGDLNIPDGEDMFSLDAGAFLAELGKALGVEHDARFQSYMHSHHRHARGPGDAQEDSDEDFLDSDDDLFENDDDDDDHADGKEEVIDLETVPYAPRTERPQFVHINENVPDSDDDELYDDDEGFDDAYTAVLREQLAGTKLDPEIIRSAATADSADALLASGLLESAAASDGAAGPTVSLLTAAGVHPADIRNIMRADPRHDD
jgi:hypothetical protein